MTRMSARRRRRSQTPRAGGDRSRTETANRAARRTVWAVGTLGFLLVAVPAVRHWRGLWADPFENGVKVTTVEYFDASHKVVATQRTTAPDSASVVEKALASGGLVLLRLALVAAAAFVAGAIVKNTMLGNYPIKVAGVELDQLTDKAEETARDAKESVERLADLMQRLFEEAATQSADTVARVKEELQAEIDALRAGGTPRPPPP